MYKGAFVENLFEGEGNLYRENGTKQYEGSFENGEEEGTGTLYNAAESPVFTGSFHRGQIVYSQFLNKSAEDVYKRQGWECGSGILPGSGGTG